MATTSVSGLSNTNVASYTSSTGATSIAGLQSNFNWQTLVTQLVAIERIPEQQMQKSQSSIQTQADAYSRIETELNTLQTKINNLQDPTLFENRSATSSDSTIATATADVGTATGTYTFNFTQLATAATLKSGTGVGGKLNSSDVTLASPSTGPTLSSAGFSSPVTAGNFTINGTTVAVATTDTLQSLFNKIYTATNTAGDAVTASYSTTDDTITLSSASGKEITLGSSSDTSNFLQQAHLYNTGAAGAVTSASTLGRVMQSTPLSSANLSQAINDGGSGSGAFKINGVTINYNVSTDSLNTVMARINSSTAGVMASYDPTNNQLLLTSKTTGDVGIPMQDVTGNFLAATKLSSGTLQHGKNLLYSVNGSGTLVSTSNTITGDSSNITGLTVTALQENKSASITVANNTSSVKTAITDFVSEYNTVQSLIDSYSSTMTDAKGSVVGNTLTGDTAINALSDKLRNITFGQFSGLSGLIKNFSSLGIKTSSTSNSVTVDTASGTLDNMLANNFSAVEDFFTNASNGVGKALNDYINTAVTGDTAWMVSSQANFAKQIKDLTSQIATQETYVQSFQDRLTASFVAMETAQSNMATQLQYIQSLGK